ERQASAAHRGLCRRSDPGGNGRDRRLESAALDFAGLRGPRRPRRPAHTRRPRDEGGRQRAGVERAELPALPRRAIRAHLSTHRRAHFRGGARRVPGQG
ncbi:MAG: hypothetical protein AVDCRST_MAG69-2019, partial [uncultured Solirubrobacteraceae bacterium]